MTYCMQPKNVTTQLFLEHSKCNRNEDLAAFAYELGLVLFVGPCI